MNAFNRHPAFANCSGATFNRAGADVARGKNSRPTRFQWPGGTIHGFPSSYVGQADGHGGFLGRWEEYVRNGHGGNVAMKALPRNDYVVRILEIGSDDELFQKERRWKEILGTQISALGLNRN